jgi:hypothetical protein
MPDPELIIALQTPIPIFILASYGKFQGLIDALWQLLI